VDTAHYKGPVSKTVTVTTSDPQKNTFVLTLKGTIISYVDVNPDSAYIRTFEGETGSQTVELKAAQDKSFTVQKVVVDNPKLNYTLAPPMGTVIAKDQSIRITVASPADMPSGNSQGTIKITTNLADQPEVELPWTVTVQKLITIAPAQVFMNISLRPYKIQAAAVLNAMAEPSPTAAPAGALEAGKDYPVSDVQKNYVQIRFPDAKLGWVELAKVKPSFGGTQNSIWVSKHQAPSAVPPPAAPAGAGQAAQPQPPTGNDPDFKVTDAKCDLAFVKLTVESKQTGAYTVSIVYEGAMEEKTFKGTITLTTNDAKEPQIQVPLQITLGQTSERGMHPVSSRPELKPVTAPMTLRPPAKPGEGK